MFDIRFDNSASDDLDSDSSQGVLLLGQHRHLFSSSLEFWSPVDYELQWRRGIRNLVQGGEKSCLVTSITNPANANFLVWWILYRESVWDISQLDLAEHSPTSPEREDIIVFRNDMLLLEDIRGEFDLQYLEEFVPEREIQTFEMDDRALDSLIVADRGQRASSQPADDARETTPQESTPQQLTPLEPALKESDEPALDSTSSSGYSSKEWSVPFSSIEEWYQKQSKQS